MFHCDDTGTERDTEGAFALARSIFPTSEIMPRARRDFRLGTLKITFRLSCVLGILAASMLGCGSDSDHEIAGRFFLPGGKAEAGLALWLYCDYKNMTNLDEWQWAVLNGPDQGSTTKTDGSGEYRFESEEANSMFRDCFLTAPKLPDGRRSAAILNKFTSYPASRVDDIGTWAIEPSVAYTGTTIDVTWALSMQPHESDVARAVLWSSDSKALWIASAKASAGRLSIPAYLAEDFGNISVQVQIKSNLHAPMIELQASKHISISIDSAVVPASRGAGCGTSVCQFTDAKLDSVENSNGDVILELLNEATPKHAVVRNMKQINGRIYVESSLDGKSYQPAGMLNLSWNDTGFLDIPLSVSVPARYFRISIYSTELYGPRPLSGVAEISLLE